MPSDDDFSLKTNNEQFSARLNSVFDGITALEQQHEQWKNNQDLVQNEQLWKPEPKEEMSSTSDATFKIPKVSPRAFQMKRHLPSLDYVPNFRRNPSKWTKYSLADVPELSELSNTRAALSFLEDRKRQKLQTSENNTSNECSRKILFKKPKTTETIEMIETEETGDNNDGLSLDKAFNKTNVGKLVMPEYVVGAKRIRASHRSNDTCTAIINIGSPCASTSVHLEHLDDENYVENKDGSQAMDENARNPSVFYKFTKKGSRQFKEQQSSNDLEFSAVEK